jgi:LytS/YehU family sensor histidine kinase
MYYLHPSRQTFSLKQLLLIGSVVTAFFLIYVRYQKRKLNKTQQQEATMQLKLRSLKSQLNPHFLFNALSAIQNLVKKNEYSRQTFTSPGLPALPARS